MNNFESKEFSGEEGGGMGGDTENWNEEDSEGECAIAKVWELERPGGKRRFIRGRGWVREGEENWEEDREWYRRFNESEGWRRGGEFNEKEMQRRFYYNCQASFPSPTIEKIAKWDSRTECKRVELKMLEKKLEILEKVGNV